VQHMPKKCQGMPVQLHCRAQHRTHKILSLCKSKLIQGLKAALCRAVFACIDRHHPKSRMAHHTQLCTTAALQLSNKQHLNMRENKHVVSHQPCHAQLSMQANLASTYTTPCHWQPNAASLALLCYNQAVPFSLPVL
jgi:hypothetical protein